jgi:hypothetical protein
VQFVHDGVKVPLRVDCSAIITSPRSLVRGRFVPGYSSSEIVVRRPELEAALAALTGKQVTIGGMGALFEGAGWCKGVEKGRIGRTGALLGVAGGSRAGGEGR